MDYEGMLTAMMDENSSLSTRIEQPSSSVALIVNGNLLLTMGESRSHNQHETY